MYILHFIATRWTEAGVCQAHPEGSQVQTVQRGVLLANQSDKEGVSIGGHSNIKKDYEKPTGCQVW